MFFDRLIRAIQLDPHVFLEVAEDKSSFASAMAIALFSSVATGIGGVGGYVEKIPLAIFLAFAGWTTWTISIYMIGARLLPAQETKVSLSAVFRATGFASAPGLLRFLAYFPAFSVIVTLGATLWMLGATLVAVQQVLHYQSMPRTVGVSFIGWVVYQWLLITI